MVPPSPSGLSPNKPGKVRRVANAASIFKGQSLNTILLPGPDLINNLFGILLRFREKPITVMADIEAMFMQIAIITEDQSCLRFLWPTDETMKQYQYTRLIFGARCSPASAIFVLQRSAQEPQDRKFLILSTKVVTWMISFIPSKALKKLSCVSLISSRLSRSVASI